MLRIFSGLILSCLLIMASCGKEQQKSQLARLKLRENQFTEGVLRKDTQLLNSVFADTFVDTFPNGQMVNKQQYLALIKADTSKIESLKVGDARSQFYGNTAVVTEKFTVKGQDKGKGFSSTGRATDVWVRMKGDWYCVAAHSSLIR